MSTRRARPPEAAVRERRQDVLRHVIAVGETRIDECAEHFNVSLMTMHRDLDTLAERGLLRKLRGKVAAYPALTMETATRFRETLHRKEKDALAAAACAEVSPGDTVLLDCSSTLFPLAERLRAITPLTVLTNSLRIARTVGPGARTVLIGGHYSDEFDSCTGPEVLATLRGVHADIAFVSATAVAGGRLFHPVRDFAELKIAARRASRRNVLLVDHSKFGKTATHAHGDAGDYDLVCTDEHTPQDEIDAMTGLGAGVRIVPLTETTED